MNDTQKVLFIRFLYQKFEYIKKTIIVIIEKIIGKNSTSHNLKYALFYRWIDGKSFIQNMIDVIIRCIKSSSYFQKII